MRTVRKQIVPSGRVMDYTNGEPELYLMKPAYRLGDCELIRFQSRAALEAFNRKANLHAIVKTQVPYNCVCYKHESDSDARTARAKESEAEMLYTLRR